MKIGKREIIVNPNVTKFGCMLAIMTGWFMWPREADYQRYNAQVRRRHEESIYGESRPPGDRGEDLYPQAR